MHKIIQGTLFINPNTQKTSIIKQLEGLLGSVLFWYENTKRLEKTRNAFHLWEPRKLHLRNVVLCFKLKKTALCSISLRFEILLESIFEKFFMLFKRSDYANGTFAVFFFPREWRHCLFHTFSLNTTFYR